MFISGRHCCLYCLTASEKLHLQPSIESLDLRTINSILHDHRQFMQCGGDRRKAKEFNNVIHVPLLKSIPLSRLFFCDIVYNISTLRSVLRGFTLLWECLDISDMKTREEHHAELKLSTRCIHPPVIHVLYTCAMAYNACYSRCITSVSVYLRTEVWIACLHFAYNDRIQPG